MPGEDAVVIRVTDDLDAVRTLCVQAGLDMQDGPLDGIVVAYGAYAGERFVGCATMQSLEGGRFLEYVAVDAGFRNRGIGAMLVARIEEEARAMGMRELWAKARAPGFYQRIGYRVLGDGERGPKNLDTCRDCPQFRRDCFPVIVVKTL